MKRCYICGNHKPLEAFHFLKKSKDGRKSGCKECRSEQARQWRLNNHDLALAKGKEARIRNRTKDLVAKQRWREKHPEHQKRLVSEWARRFPEKRNSITRNYRARKHGASGTHTYADIKRLMLKQGGRCVLCETRLMRYHVDHVVPLARGGGNGPDNLQLLCPTCNHRKGARIAA